MNTSALAMILLEVDPQTLRTVNVCITIFFIIDIILALYFLKFKKGNETNAKEYFEDFLEDIKVACLDATLSTITNYKPGKEITKDDIIALQADLVAKITDNVYDVCVRKLDEEYSENRYYPILKKYINREKVAEYVIILIGDKTINEKIADLLNSIMKTSFDKMESDEREAEKLVEENFYEHVDNYHPEELDPTVKRDFTGEVISPDREIIEEEINPPKDDVEDDVIEEGTYDIVE